MEKKTALVTGASSGLGKAFAERLAAQGYDLYIVARRLERLETIAAELGQRHKVKVTPVGLDLAKPQDREALWVATGGEKSEINLLINNAGFGVLKPLSEQDRLAMLNMVEVNVAAVVDLTHRYLGGMVKRQRGEIVIVASLAGFQPVPYFSVYGATKGFDLLFGESLFYEVARHGVHVLTLCPGVTATEFGEVAGIKNNGLIPKGMGAEAVVDITLRALRRRKRLVVPGLSNKATLWLQRFFPRGFNNRVSAMIFQEIAKRQG